MPCESPEINWILASQGRKYNERYLSGVLTIASVTTNSIIHVVSCSYHEMNVKVLRNISHGIVLLQ